MLNDHHFGPLSAPPARFMSGSHSASNLGSPITVILDLDESLIHATELGSDEAVPQHSEHSFSVKVGAKTYHVKKRPGLDSFLKYFGDHPNDFRVFLFTAAEETYASAILDILDPNHSHFTTRFYRKACVERDGVLVKDIARVTDDLSRAVLIDDNPLCHLPQPRNGIVIRSFYGQLGDNELTLTLPLMEDMRTRDGDVRLVLSQKFGPRVQRNIRRCHKFLLAQRLSGQLRSDCSA